MLFCPAISAVDPIGVLTIFDTIGIHKDIYYILFGESVLNGKRCIPWPLNCISIKNHFLYFLYVRTV